MRLICKWRGLDIIARDLPRRTLPAELDHVKEKWKDAFPGCEIREED